MDIHKSTHDFVVPKTRHNSFIDDPLLKAWKYFGIPDSIYRYL